MNCQGRECRMARPLAYHSPVMARCDNAMQRPAMMHRPYSYPRSNPYIDCMYCETDPHTGVHLCRQCVTDQYAVQDSYYSNPTCECPHCDTMTFRSYGNRYQPSTIDQMHGPSRLIPSRRSPYRGMDLMGTGNWLGSLGGLSGMSGLSGMPSLTGMPGLTPRNHLGRYGSPRERLGLGWRI